jgi:hypothetical protein
MPSEWNAALAEAERVITHDIGMRGGAGWNDTSDWDIAQVRKLIAGLKKSDLLSQHDMHPYVVEYDRACAEGRKALIAQFENREESVKTFLSQISGTARLHGPADDRMLRPLPAKDLIRVLRHCGMEILRTVIGPYRFMVPGLQPLLEELNDAIHTMDATYGERTDGSDVEYLKPHASNHDDWMKGGEGRYVQRVATREGS